MEKLSVLVVATGIAIGVSICAVRAQTDRHRAGQSTIRPEGETKTLKTESLGIRHEVGILNDKTGPGDYVTREVSGRIVKCAFGKKLHTSSRALKDFYFVAPRPRYKVRCHLPF